VVDDPQSHSVHWKVYVDDIWREKDKAILAALAAAKEAVLVAEANSEKWRANANEWRAAMTDRDKLYMTRTEFEAYKSATDKGIDDLRKAQQTQEGVRQGLSDGWGWMAGIIGLAIAIATYFTKE
jgi:Flp pilus assembly protein TadB